MYSLFITWIFSLEIDGVELLEFATTKEPPSEKTKKWPLLSGTKTVI
jgi:hypothetical protein